MYVYIKIFGVTNSGGYGLPILPPTFLRCPFNAALLPVLGRECLPVVCLPLRFSHWVWHSSAGCVIWTGQWGDSHEEAVSWSFCSGTPLPSLVNSSGKGWVIGPTRTSSNKWPLFLVKSDSVFDQVTQNHLWCLSENDIIISDNSKFSFNWEVTINGVFYKFNPFPKQASHGEIFLSDHFSAGNPNFPPANVLISIISTAMSIRFLTIQENLSLDLS